MHFRSSKWVTESTATSVSGDRSQFLECVCDACLARSKSLVSASSWSERSSGTISQWPCVRNTVFMSSFKPPARKTFCWGLRLWVKRLKSAQHKKSAKLSLFQGFEMYFPHCFGIGVESLEIVTSNELVSPLLCRSPSLMTTSDIGRKLNQPASSCSDLTREWFACSTVPPFVQTTQNLLTSSPEPKPSHQSQQKLLELKMVVVKAKQPRSSLKRLHVTKQKMFCKFK